MGKSVRYDLMEDWTGEEIDDDCVHTLVRKCAQLADRGVGLYIGKASSGNPPESRWRRKYRPRGYGGMVVLCKTDTVDEAFELEASLIDRLIDLGYSVDNELGGGGGGRGHGEGYVYLVYDSDDGSIVDDMILSILTGSLLALFL